MGVILNVALWVIGLWILHGVIRSAIDGSQTAEHIRDIRGMLKERNSCVAHDQPEESYEALEVPFDECPACHSKILTTDKACPSCGLALINKDSN